MFFDLVEALATCLDRESARRIVKLNLEKIIAEHAKEFKANEGHRASPRDETMEKAICFIATEFVVELQKKTRGILRQPAGSSSAQKA